MSDTPANWSSGDATQAEDRVSRPTDSSPLAVTQIYAASAPPLPGNVALRDWFSEKRGRRGGLAAVLGLSIGTVSGWGRQNNHTRPHEAIHLFAIEKLADVPLAAWLAPGELETLAPVLDNWQDHVYVPQRRRQVIDSRQMSIDELLARQSPSSTSEQLDSEFAREVIEEPDDEPLDIDEMMDGTP